MTKNCWDCVHGRIDEDDDYDQTIGTGHTYCDLDGNTHKNDTCDKFVGKGERE